MRHFIVFALILLVVGCASKKDKKEFMLFKDEHGKNAYFDRFNELVNFGTYQDFKLLIGYDFKKVEGLLFSTSIYEFNVVPKNQTKTRMFVLLNPQDEIYKGVKYEMVGDPEFVIAKNNCGPLIREHKICSISVKFKPTNKTEAGRKQARLVIKYPTNREIVKEIRGMVP